jgi:hypothetical protein
MSRVESCGERRGELMREMAWKNKDDEAKLPKVLSEL